MRSVAVSPADRHTLISSAPEGEGDHVVSIQRKGGPGVGPSYSVYAVVRRDSTTRAGRIVALGCSADEVLAKAAPRPAFSVSEPTRVNAYGRREARRSGRVRRGAAVNELRGELAEYRRTVATVAGVAAKLV